LKERFHLKEGVHIHLDKQIPVAAGLAGGSSDAAAALRGLNRLWQLNLTTEELCRLGSELGSDVPFCVTGGTALATGRGEQLQPLPPPPQCWVIIVKPSISVSTSDVYGRLRADAIEHHPRTNHLLDAIARGDYYAICNEMGNVLESVTLQMHPEVGGIKKMMLKLGADCSLMSGSGPTVFGLVQREAKAEKIYNGLRGFCKEVYVVRLLPEISMNLNA
jgi:4-diphosphocytidyl-2-C-methyl-D-erythritol kinase